MIDNQNKNRILEIMREHDLDYPEACMMLLDNQDHALRSDPYEKIDNIMINLSKSLYKNEISRYFTNLSQHHLISSCKNVSQ